MRYSSPCACKFIIKLAAIFLLVIIILSVSFNQHSQSHANTTNSTPPQTPEQELDIYIRNISSWKTHNDSAVVNQHPYRYIFEPSGICKNDNNPFLLIIIKSYVSNVGHREAIRATWGKELPPSAKLVFILGHLDVMQAYIDIESNKYKDIIEEDFIDVYRNNTIKTIMGFNWAVENCPNTKYFFFVDDDYLVNIHNVLNYLKNYSTKQRGSGLYVGYRWEKAYPKRSNVSKWFVSTEDYPCRIWPPYVGGGSMITSYDVALNMKKSFPYIKPIFIDDVYIGIVAATIGIKPQMDGRFSPDYHPKKIRKMFSTHGVSSSSAMLQDWEMIKDVVKLKQ